MRAAEPERADAASIRAATGRSVSRAAGSWNACR